MKLSLYLAASLGIAASAPARAEFLLAPSGAPPATVSAPAPGMASIAIPPRPRSPSLPAAKGYGEAVPLHVAARQIAPEETSVVFGDGVDRELPVNWQGGRPWNLVMADAIRPLGLKVVRAPGQVTITR